MLYTRGKQPEKNLCHIFKGDFKNLRINLKNLEKIPKNLRKISLKIPKIFFELFAPRMYKSQ